MHPDPTDHPERARVVAQHADRSNFGGKPHEWKHKAEVLQKHCTAVTRDYVLKNGFSDVVIGLSGGGPYALAVGHERHSAVLGDDDRETFGMVVDEAVGGAAARDALM